MNPYFTYDSSQQIKISIGTLRTTSLKKNHAVTNRSNRTKETYRLINGRTPFESDTEPLYCKTDLSL